MVLVSPRCGARTIGDVLVGIIARRMTAKWKGAEVGVSNSTYNSSVNEHKLSRSKVNDSWNAWAKQNYNELPSSSVHQGVLTSAVSHAVSEEEADMLAGVGASSL